MINILYHTNMENKIKKEVEIALGQLGVKDVLFEVEHPADMSRGDFAVNVAMSAFSKVGPKVSSKVGPKVSSKVGPTPRKTRGKCSQERASGMGPTFRSPRELAEKIVDKLHEGNLKQMASKIQVAGAGLLIYQSKLMYLSIMLRE